MGYNPSIVRLFTEIFLNMPTLALNKRAKYDYELIETYEAGIALTGQETKAAKSGHISLKGAHVSAQKGELFLAHTLISKYRFAGKLPDYDPTRLRKLLLRKKEISRLLGKIQEKGLTLIPIRVYTKANLIKVEIALGRGKKKIDKRETIKKREVDRDLRRRMK